MSVKLSDTEYLSLMNREEQLVNDITDIRAKLAQAERERDAAMKVINSKPRKKATSEPAMEVFRYQENLRSIVRDLRAIDSLIPAEVSRHGCLMDPRRLGEEMAIIEARKSDLLRYIQTICHDHIRWSDRLLNERGKP